MGRAYGKADCVHPGSFEDVYISLGEPRRPQNDVTNSDGTDQDKNGATSAPQKFHPLFLDKLLRMHCGDQRRDQKSTMTEGVRVLTIPRQYKSSNRHRFVHPSSPILIVRIGSRFSCSQRRTNLAATSTVPIQA